MDDDTEATYYCYIVHYQFHYRHYAAVLSRTFFLYQDYNDTTARFSHKPRILPRFSFRACWPIFIFPPLSHTTLQVLLLHTCLLRYSRATSSTGTCTCTYVLLHLFFPRIAYFFFAPSSAPRRIIFEFRKRT
jgi:hypothetical protein